MAYSRAALCTARVVATLSKVYWDRRCFVDRRAFGRASRAWLSALVQFVSGYSYERNRAPLAYRRISRDALLHAGHGLLVPHGKFVQATWTRFEKLARADGLQTNPIVDPLAPPSALLTSATAFVAHLKSDGFNILRWARRLLRTGQASLAVEALREIRGIGPKLATFYLRDVAWHFDLESRCGDRRCLQPVDVWIERAVAAWAGQPISGGYWRKASVMVEVADAAGVSAVDLNAGAWILGSQCQPGSLSTLLRNPRELRRCLRRNTDWCAAFAEHVGPLTQP
jgi:hypothetical protein